MIAGGSGFLGRAVARHFAAQDWDVVIVSRSRPPVPTPGRWVVPWCLPGEAFTFGHPSWTGAIRDLVREARQVGHAVRRSGFRSCRSG